VCPSINAQHRNIALYDGHNSPLPAIACVAKRWRGVEAADDRIGSSTAVPVSVSLDTNATVSAATTETTAGRAPARGWPTRALTLAASRAD
jgi:hypothetical protein